MIPLKGSRLKRYALYGIVFFLILSLFSPFIITRLINTAYLKNELTDIIFQKTGARVDPSAISLLVFPRPVLNIENFNFSPGKGVAVRMKALKFSLDLPTLLRGNINIAQITVDRPDIQVSFAKENPSHPKVFFPVPRGSLWMEKIFSLLPGHQDSVELRIKNGTSPYFGHMDGTLYLSKEKKEILLSATINEIAVNPGTLSDNSLEKYSDLTAIALDQLKINATLNVKGDLQGQCRMTALTLASKTRTLLQSDRIVSTFKWSDAFYQIDISPFKLNDSDGLVGIRFSNDPANKKTQIQFSGTRIRIDTARQTALSLFREDYLTRTIFDILKGGIAPRVEVSFQGRDLKDLFHGDHLILTGNIEDGSVKIPATHLTASHISGEARLKGGILDIQAKKAMLHQAKVEKGTLSIDLLNFDTVPFQGEFFLDVNLSTVPGTLISLLPDTLLARELSRVHGVEGRAKVKLGLSQAKGSQDLDVAIDAADFSVSGTYDRIPNDIYLENLTFKYEPDRVSLTHLSGMVNGTRMDDLDAVIDFRREAWLHIRSGSGTLPLKSVIPWLLSHEKTRKMISPVREGSGTVHVSSVDLSGPVLKPDQWKYNVNGTGSGIHLTTHANQKEIENLSCQYQAANDFFNLKIMKMKVAALSWLAPLQGKKHLDSVLVPLDMDEGQFQFTPGQSSFNGRVKFTTGPLLAVELKGDTIASLALKTLQIFDKKATNATISFLQPPEKALYDFTGRLNTATLNKIIVPDSYWAKKIHALTEGQSILIHTDPSSNLNIITKNINLNAFLSGSGSVVPRDRRFLPNHLIHVKADTLKIKHLTFRDIDTTLSLKKGDTAIRVNHAFLCDLETNGVLDFKKDNIHADLPFEAADKANIQTLLTCLFQKDNLMDGQYSLTGRIVSDGLKKNSLHTLAGSFTLNAEEGRIYKWTLLSRILSVLNVSKIFKGSIPDVTQEGFAYKTISITAEIKDSVIHLTQAVINGYDMTLIFSGWIDPVNDALDLTCLVAPFKTIDLIIEKIPIVNTLLNGRLVSIPIQGTGKLSDPTVIPLHPSAVGNGLVNMMSDILKTPVKLWDKIYTE